MKWRNDALLRNGRSIFLEELDLEFPKTESVTSTCYIEGHALKM